MKRNFGFKPYEGREKYGFVSYKSEEYLSVGKYAKALNDRGIRLWYDYGIPAGKWEDTISEKIVGASFIVLFVSAKIFQSKVIKEEIQTAQKWDIPVIPVFMEYISRTDIKGKDAIFFTQLDSLQGVSDVQKMSVETVADELEMLVRPKIDNDKDAAIISRRASYERERQSWRRQTVQPPQSQANQPTQQSQPGQLQNRSKSTEPVFHVTEDTKPISQPVINKKIGELKSFFKKCKPVIAAAIVLAVAVVVVYAVNGIAYANNNSKSTVSEDDTTFVNDNLSDMKHVNDIISINELSVGSHVYFGTYEQDNNTSNLTEDIEWLVLAIEDGKALLITEYLLEYVQYNEEDTAVTWENSTLRQWMNNDFFNAAFTDEERSKIAATTLNNADNPDYGIGGGNDTIDKIFALSIDEAEKYFSSDDDRVAYVTEYAKSRDYCNSSGSEWWWLRSPGKDGSRAANISYIGGFYNDGVFVNFNDVAVRPALWVEL